MGMVRFPSDSMIVNQFNIKGVIAFKSKNDSPICPYGHGPEPSQIAFHRMEPIPGNIQGLRRSGGIENRKDSLNCLDQVRPYPARVAALVKAFQAPVLETSDHRSRL